MEPSTVFVIWQIFCLVAVIAFVVLLFRFLYKQGGPQKKNGPAHAVLFILLAMSFANYGCKEDDSFANGPAVARSNASEQPQKRDLDKSDAGKTALKFASEEAAEAYALKYGDYLNGKLTKEEIFAAAGFAPPTALIESFERGDSLTYRTVRSLQPIGPSQTSSLCWFEYCTDWYNSPSGGFIATTCTYGVEPCDAGGGPVITGHGSGSGPIGGSSPNGHGTASGSASSSGGGFRNGTGTAIFHAPYIGLTNIEVTAAVQRNQLTTATSTLTGLTLGGNYVQTSFLQTGFANGILSFTITYNLSLVLFTNGIGTVWTYSGQTVDCEIDTRTGRGRILH